jgi:hypothetical protein
MAEEFTFETLYRVTYHVCVISCLGRISIVQIFSHGVGLSALVTETTLWPIVPAPDDR